MGETDKAKRTRINPGPIVGLLVIIIVAAVGVYFALRSAQPVPVPIGTVLGDLRTYDGKVVTVKGRVTETVNVFGLKTYTVQDETGDMMVITQRGLPNKGEEVTVTGIVNEMFNLGGVNMTVLQEPRPEGDKAPQ